MVGARLFPLLALCTLAACKDPTNEKLLDLLDDYGSERDAIRALICTCPEELNAASSDECEQAQVDLGSDQKQCIADVFDGQDELAVDYFECVVPLQRAYQECLSDYLGECTTNWFAPCDMAYDDAVLDTCPELPSSVEAGFSQCLPSTGLP